VREVLCPGTTGAQGVRRNNFEEFSREPETPQTGARSPQEYVLIHNLFPHSVDKLAGGSRRWVCQKRFRNALAERLPPAHVPVVGRVRNRRRAPAGMSCRSPSGLTGRVRLPVDGPSGRSQRRRHCRCAGLPRRMDPRLRATPRSGGVRGTLFLRRRLPTPQGTSDLFSTRSSGWSVIHGTWCVAARTWTDCAHGHRVVL